MIRPDRGALTAFAARFAVVFVISLLPLPWLADAWVTAAGGAMNGLVWGADAASSYAFRFEPPPRVERDGSWKGTLRIADRTSGEVTLLKVDMRSYSFHPIATFVALAFASRIRAMARRVALWACGLLSMWLATAGFLALPILSRFAAAGAFGEGPGRLVWATYQAMATPVMVYALPVFVWWVWLHLTADLEPAPPPRTGMPDAPDPALSTRGSAR